MSNSNLYGALREKLIVEFYSERKHNRVPSSTREIELSRTKGVIFHCLSYWQELKTWVHCLKFSLFLGGRGALNRWTQNLKGA